METKSYANNRGTHGRRSERFEELTSQLTASDMSRLQRSTDKIARDAQFQLAEIERQKGKMEEERKMSQAEMAEMRQAMDKIVSTT